MTFVKDARQEVNRMNVPASLPLTLQRIARFSGYGKAFRFGLNYERQQIPADIALRIVAVDTA